MSKPTREEIINTGVQLVHLRIYNELAQRIENKHKKQIIIEQIDLEDKFNKMLTEYFGMEYTELASEEMKREIESIAKEINASIKWEDKIVSISYEGETDNGTT